MTPDEFRVCGRQAVDWIADYMESVEQYPVVSRVEPGDIRSQLPDHPPAEGESFDEILADVNRIVLPGITHWQSPNFFAFFPANNSGPSILGELLAAGLGVQGMLWATSPACTELETHVLDWLVEMLALPEKFKSTSRGGGVIQDTASSATLCALVAARERATNGHSNRSGIEQQLTAYASTQAHSSVEKAMMIAGLGSENLRQIETNANYAMRPELLRDAISTDVAAGFQPCFVCGTVGTTSAGAVDPLAAIGEICRDHRMWLHVDAAMAGTAALCEEFRFVHDGLELADSYCFNPHKWMFVNFDCDCFYVAERAELINAMSVLPEYLKNRATQSGEVIDYRDWQVPLGRRFRALKLWFVIRSYGVRRLQTIIREHVRLARQFSTWIEKDPDFELAAPVVLNLVCFSHRGGDSINQQLLERVNGSGKIYVTHTKLADQLTLRMSIGQTNTEQRHVEQAWKLLRETASSL
jgi:aromatic-L-amino-acid decarboxylase